MLHAARLRASIRDQRGFTLIELLIVLIIMAILLTIVVSTNIGARRQASDTAAKSLVYQILPSMEAYAADNGGYAGMTLGQLQAQYNQAIDPAKYRLRSLTASGYCVQATSGAETWRKNGPGQPLEKLACP